MALTQIQKDLLFGTLLGDGSLSTGSGGRTWRYRATHGELQKEYLDHKYQILSPLCGSGPFIETKYSRSPTITNNYSFNTLINSSLCFYGNMFYTYNAKTQRWVKDVPIKTQLFLTPRALAYFYMDDGALKWGGKSNAMRLCTESFSHEGVARLRDALKHSFDLSTGVSKKTLSSGAIGLRISIPERSSAAFRELIRPFLVDCMRYKVSDGQRGHL